MDPARFIAARFSQFTNCFFPSPRPERNPTEELGQRGEFLAAQYLRRLRYKILYRNFRAPHGGEVDLVCRHLQTLVFVEVKTRRSRQFGPPSAAVDFKKQRLIARGALAWLRLLDFPKIPFRFDIVEVLLESEVPHFNLIENAFEMPEPLIY